MFLTRALQCWHPNSILITRPAFMSSQWGQKREANFLLCRLPIIMSLHQKQETLSRSHLEAQQSLKGFEDEKHAIRCRRVFPRQKIIKHVTVNVSATSDPYARLWKKHHHWVWPPGQLEMSVPPQTLKYERRSAQCWSGVHLVPDMGLIDQTERWRRQSAHLPSQRSCWKWRDPWKPHWLTLPGLQGWGLEA